METAAWHSMIALQLHRADLTGLCLLTALLAISAWTCLRPQPVLRQTRPPASQTFGFYLLLCAIAAPLLMYACLDSGLGLLQQAQPQLKASAQWQPYRTMLWLLYGLALGEWPIIVANLITLVLAFTILLRTWRARAAAARLRTGC